MARPVPLALGALLLATLAAALAGGPQALGVAGVAWGAALTAAMLWRLVRRDFSGRVLALCMLFACANLLWIGADALALADLGPATGAGFPAAADLLTGAGSIIFCGVIVWVGRMRGLWPDPARQLDGMVFAASLATPLWFGLLAPNDAPLHLVVWGITSLALLGFGATYVLGGGIWNVPAVLLALGVVGNVAVQLGMRIADPAATSVLPAHGFGFVLWTIAVLHPRLPEVFAGGHRVGGVPLEVRVWLLGPCLCFPLGALAWSYVVGKPVPITIVVGAIALVTLIIGVHAALEARAGVESWHVSLTVSFTTLIAAMAAVLLALAGQAAQRAYERADRLAATIPAVERLDAQLLRATGAADTRVPGSSAQWARSVATLRRELSAQEPAVRALLDTYASRGAAAIADDGRDERRVDSLAGPAYTELVGGLRTAVAADRADGKASSRRARLLTIGVLVGGLIAITLLLLRFSFAGRRLAVAYLERHDALTGLPNRAALEQRLHRGGELALAGSRGRGLILLDLDDFKSINDVHGHTAGDALLQAAAERLAPLVVGTDLLARIDGDAFALLVEGEGREAEVEELARNLAAVLAEPFTLGDRTYALAASIGVATTADAGEDADVGAGEARALVILRNAELAMYEAKRVTGTAIVHFAPSMHEAACDRIALTAELRGAVEREELHLVYQPIVDLQTGRALGYEALIRWNHPTRGPLSPAEFIPLAEATGLIVPLGGWVLHEACRQLQVWQAGWPDRRYISVNIASQQFATGVFPGQVREALAASGLPAQQLLLEVTESSLIENIAFAQTQMDEVKALGARIALDDFGTGYSSLSYLRQFRVDVVKVDKSFIDDVVDSDGSSLVEAIVHMASSLRMKVVAEGIEADDQADELRRLGCELGQGFRFSRPLAARDVVGAPTVFGEDHPAQALLDPRSHPGTARAA